MNGYECVIGLEVHVELNTETKAFCACKTDFAAPPNTRTCPVCLGHPGALPVFNKEVLNKGIAVGLALNCEIQEYSRFDRKNYFYPDLPKGYQITQFYHPLCRNGYLTVDTPEGKKRIGITEIHIEEDAGKLTHRDNITEIDCNRCGVPLLEIVSEPDMRSADEARDYLKKLRSLILFTGASDCKMNEGSMRCDVNISVRKKGDTALGTRTEIKNLNSFKFASRAIEYEFIRQCKVLESGKRVERQTMRFDPNTGTTSPMRTKEDTSDYRYFPEPDLLPIYTSADTVKKIRKSLPPLPGQLIEEFGEKYDIPEKDSVLLTETPELASFFKEAASTTEYPKTVANMILSDIPAMGEKDDWQKTEPHSLGRLAQLFGTGNITSATVKKLLRRLLTEKLDIDETVAREKLLCINDEKLISEYIEEAVKALPAAVADYKKGKKTASTAIMGKAMGAGGGRLNPEKLRRLLTEYLDGLE